MEIFGEVYTEVYYTSKFTFCDCTETSQAEQESKIQTEDLLAQQFSGKKIDKESVELLRSLLNGLNSIIIIEFFKNQDSIDCL